MTGGRKEKGVSVSAHATTTSVCESHRPRISLAVQATCDTTCTCSTGLAGPSTGEPCSGLLATSAVRLVLRSPICATVSPCASPPRRSPCDGARLSGRIVALSGGERVPADELKLRRLSMPPATPPEGDRLFPTPVLLASERSQLARGMTTGRSPGAEGACESEKSSSEKVGRSIGAAGGGGGRRGARGPEEEDEVRGGSPRWKELLLERDEACEGSFGVRSTSGDGGDRTSDGLSVPAAASAGASFSFPLPLTSDAAGRSVAADLGSSSSSALVSTPADTTTESGRRAPATLIIECA